MHCAHSGTTITWPVGPISTHGLLERSGAAQAACECSTAGHVGLEHSGRQTRERRGVEHGQVTHDARHSQRLAVLHLVPAQAIQNVLY